MEELINTIEKDCFLCTPEEWRILYKGNYVQVLSGTGPLCSGYIIIAPIEHKAKTISNLSEKEFEELQTINTIIISSYHRQYGKTYTSYEHGRLGSCDLLENESCSHAHRVFIPMETDCLKIISQYFENVNLLLSDRELIKYQDVDYIYYETTFENNKYVFTDPITKIPPQFMRRIIADELNKANWNWAFDINYEEMINTVATLKSEFLGLSIFDSSPIGLNKKHKNSPFQKNIFINGLSCVGKTTIGSRLAQIYGCKLVDTGLIFRYIAYCKCNRIAIEDINKLKKILFETKFINRLRTDLIAKKANKIAQYDIYRNLYKKLLKEIMNTYQPCIVIGRDTWKLKKNEELSFEIISDIDTRVKRKLLLNNKHIISKSYNEQKKLILTIDNRDNAKIPPANLNKLYFIENGKRSFNVVINEIISIIEGNYE